MPVESPAAPAVRRGDIQVVASAPVEVAWLIYRASAVPEQSPVATLRDELEAFWGDQLHFWNEILVVALRTGTFAEPDLAPMLVAAAGGVPDGPLALETETDADRASTGARLGRLAAEPALRARWIDLLGRVWSLGTLSAADRAARERTVQAWRARVAEGASPLELVGPKHVARRDEFRHLLDAAVRRGEVTMSPAASCQGGHIVALPGMLSIGAPGGDVDSLELRRFFAGEVAGRIKVLSDPTRVALLSQLACESMTVTELAEAFDLAQPTVSVHVRQLREAGLVEARKEGTRTIYSATGERVQRLLDEAGDLLLRVCER
jgi:ArsR family transcriptional regulator, arsenate/arsenite/antimonite-responsive transcriptional repressor